MFRSNICQENEPTQGFFWDLGRQGMCRGYSCPLEQNPTQTEQGLRAGTENQEGETFPNSWFSLVEQYQHRDFFFFFFPKLRTFLEEQCPTHPPSSPCLGAGFGQKFQSFQGGRGTEKSPGIPQKAKGARARQSEAGKAPLSPRAVFNSLSGCLGSLFLSTWN